MKILEKIIKNEILTAIEGKLDPLQFAYQAGKDVEDAKIFILNALYKHLEKPNAHARLLFGDFSSAFNHMQPCLLIEGLISDFKLPHELVLLILDFLTNRQQRVIVNGHLSDTVVTNTGSPQGCVLSPILYILYSDSCRSSCDSSFLVKFSDDTVLLSLLQGAQHNHGVAFPAFVDWCKDNFLELNASKTKEMIDFKCDKKAFTESVIDRDKIEIVSSYKYLGTVFDNQLKLDVNTEALVKRGQQRTHLLRMLNSFSVSPVLTIFNEHIYWCVFFCLFVFSLSPHF